ncbi:MAG: hypothetical protein NTW14_10420 [bacterium]|nr:hypothetical protein [bacterium]
MTTILWAGCTKKTATGPDSGVPIFHLEAETPVINIGQNTALRLTPVLPIDFENLEGQLVWFSCQPDSGYFTINPSWIDLSTNGNLNPPTWFAYSGTSNDLNIALFAHVITQLQDTLAWDSCMVKIQ